MAKKINVDECAEYSAVAKKNKKPLNKKRIKTVVLLIVAVFLAVSLLMLTLYLTGVFDAVSGGRDFSDDGKKEEIRGGFTDYKFDSKDMPTGKYADFVLTCDGKEYSFKVFLFSLYAENTVSNFISLADRKYYNGKVFKDVMLEDTDKNGVYDKGILFGGGYVLNADGTYTKKADVSISPIHGEFQDNDYTKNTLSHTAGVLSMYRDIEDEYNSATTDFFFCPYDATYLNGRYAAFGKITNQKGIDALRTVCVLMYEHNKTVTIKSITISRNAK